MGLCASLSHGDDGRNLKPVPMLCQTVRADELLIAYPNLPLYETEEDAGRGGTSPSLLVSVGSSREGWTKCSPPLLRKSLTAAMVASCYRSKPGKRRRVRSELEFALDCLGGTFVTCSHNSWNVELTALRQKRGAELTVSNEETDPEKTVALARGLCEVYEACTKQTCTLMCAMPPPNYAFWRHPPYILPERRSVSGRLHLVRYGCDIVESQAHELEALKALAEANAIMLITGGGVVVPALRYIQRWALVDYARMRGECASPTQSFSSFSVGSSLTSAGTPSLDMHRQTGQGWMGRMPLLTDSQLAALAKGCQLVAAGVPRDRSHASPDKLRVLWPCWSNSD